MAADLTEEAHRTMVDGAAPGERGVVDERLRLVLLCAHPALAPETAAALTLRLALGVPTADIARLFLVPLPTMAARLTRARRRLAREEFGVPVGDALLGRVGEVADIAYLAFTAGYAPGSGTDVLRPDEAAEAIRLVRVLREVLPEEVAAEVAARLDSLLALVLLQHSRREARVRTVSWRCCRTRTVRVGTPPTPTGRGSHGTTPSWNSSRARRSCA